MAIKATTSTRGTFIQGTRLTLFLQLTDTDGQPIDASDINATIYDFNNVIKVSKTPERAAKGLYALDWDIGQNEQTGYYRAVWDYQTVSEIGTYEQPFDVQEKSAVMSPPSLYAGRILEFRESLNLMLPITQRIPIYREQARPSHDKQKYSFTFDKWNPGSIRIYKNDSIVKDGLEVDFFTGEVLFTEGLTSYDTVFADYNFRWFSDQELDRFLSNGVHLVNLFPPVSLNTSLLTVESRFIPLVLYAAAVDAIRNMMMSLQFQEPQMVFGGPEGAQKVYGNLEGLKKNYEETLNKGLEQKKFGPYKGLTKTFVTPEFALPGGRSRWFRYMFSSGA